jgi:fatty-acyl-CoA synthase
MGEKMVECKKASLAGLMQDWPLTANRFIDHAARWHASREIVSRGEDGIIERTTYADIRVAAGRLADALVRRGLQPGNRVATLAMNSARHLTVLYGITGAGLVCHTLNPRMSEDQLARIIDHAQDRLLFADKSFAAQSARLLARCPSLDEVVILPAGAMDAGGAALSLAQLIAEGDEVAVWDELNEQAAAGLCYTSGTTGDPKGVLYSHRSVVLHTLFTIQPDMFNLSANDVILPVVPMYHANGWGLPFAGPCVGAKMVMPGARLDGAALAGLIRAEGVTFSAGVPTVWLGLLDHLKSTGERLPTLRRLIVGGAALPDRMLRDFDTLGIDAVHAWGMTELAPVGGVASAMPALREMAHEQRLAYRLKQGRVPFGIDMRVVDREGSEVPRDGISVGALQMKGAAVARGYHGHGRDSLTPDGFFDTGDIASIDNMGYVKITDRAKDIIKSGGEWISSLDIENAALGCAGITLAAVIGIAHPKWDERPLLFVVAVPDSGVTAEAVLAHLAVSLPKWWLPEEVRFVDALPLGPTGKIDKKRLRSMQAGSGSLLF